MASTQPTQHDLDDRLQHQPLRSHATRRNDWHSRTCVLWATIWSSHTSNLLWEGGVKAFHGTPMEVASVQSTLPWLHFKLNLKVPCTCGKVYICETKHRLGTQIKEHKDACVKYHVEKSASAEHAWTNDHPINWAETKILQRVNRAMELVLKETLGIRTTPEDTRFNRDGGMSYRLLDRHVQEVESGASLSNAHGAHSNARGAQSGMCTNQNWLVLLYFALSVSL